MPEWSFSTQVGEKVYLLITQWCKGKGIVIHISIRRKRDIVKKTLKHAGHCWFLP